MFLAKSIVKAAKSLNITDLVFMDNDENKLRIYGGMASHVAQIIDKDINFTLTTDAVSAITDCDYIITTIRVGGDEMRVRDERIALAQNVLGQETTGAAGFSFAMRSVPALIQYCELIKKHAKPNVKVFNFTNPAGVVSQALRYAGYDFTYGICDGPAGLLREFAHLYNANPDEVVGEVFGLNHLSYFRHVYVNGTDIMPQLMKDERVFTQTDMRFFDRELVDQTGMLLNEYLYYFYYREKAVENILKAGITRGELIRDVNIGMTDELSKMDIENDFPNCLATYEKWYDKRESMYMANETGSKRNSPPWKFDIHSQDAGGYAGVALKYIRIAQSGNPGDMILVVPNNGSIPYLQDDDTIEITCTIDQNGHTPHKAPGDIGFPSELIRRVKCYERLAAQAILEKNKTKAIECLMLHPLVNSYSIAKTLVNEYIELNKDYIGTFN